MSILRKVPQQARSRDRFEKILDHADIMIGEGGYDGLKMNDLARRAEVNIASIYQYFPNSAAIARSLIERYLETYRTQLQKHLEGIGRQDTLSLLSTILDHYFLFFQRNPNFARLWAGVKSDPELKRLDVADSQENARLIAEALAEISGLPSKHFQPGCFLICDLSGNFAQTLSLLEKSQVKPLLSEYKALILHYFEARLSQSL